MKTSWKVRWLFSSVGKKNFSDLRWKVLAFLERLPSYKLYSQGWCWKLFISNCQVSSLIFFLKTVWNLLFMSCTFEYFSYKDISKKWIHCPLFVATTIHSFYVLLAKQWANLIKWYYNLMMKQIWFEFFLALILNHSLLPMRVWITLWFHHSPLTCHLLKIGSNTTIVSITKHKSILCQIVPFL